MDKKQGPGVIWDLDAGVTTNLEFPIAAVQVLKLVFTPGGGLSLGFEININLGGLKALNINEFCRYLNGAQVTVIFEPIESSTTTILIQTNIFTSFSLTTIEVETNDDLFEYDDTAFVYSVGETLTSNLDCIYETLKQTNSTLRSLVQDKEVRIFTVLNPSLTFNGLHQSLTFLVLDSASSIVVSTIPLTGSAGTSVTYPLVGTAGTLLGDTFGFSTMMGSKVTIIGTGLVYIKLISPSNLN